MMKRICLFGSSENMGGTEMYLITIVRILKNDVRFDYLVYHDCKRIPFENEIISYGGQVYREYYRNKEKNRQGYISPKKIIEKHPEWDGIYLNVQKIHTAYRLLEEAKKAGLCYRIIHAHNNNYMSQIGFKDKLYELYFLLTKRKVITHYLACSKNAGDWMFGKNTDVTVIPNAIDFNKFKMNDLIRMKMRKKYNITEDTIVLGFCGRLCYQKRPELLIDIIEEMKDFSRFTLLIVGGGELFETIRTRAVERNVVDKTIFVGATDNPNDFYQMMDCFVLPSRFEGFGIVLLEAQAAGIRCYTTDKVVPYETNVTGRVTFIPQEATASEWAKKIIEGGFDRVDCLSKLEESEYSMEVMYKKLLSVFIPEPTENTAGGGNKSLQFTLQLEVYEAAA
ncbi:MAG: glycosyltransferase [Lachnospiraceae bacterium]|nr:glycosyltransferase [Lachnospiraceae bacterium]